ncbi:unnamed protein product [Owenia fusiformis]|uniref:Hexosyltransferase n=1 Tax=Owenia fusiformis TaxID=6347 RepID=A0A8J1XWZ3_OWEFU|nr:unnamed protein product [Owenia fusiformis]
MFEESDIDDYGDKSESMTCHEFTRKLPKTVRKRGHLQAKEFFNLSYNNTAYLDAIRYIYPAKNLCERKSYTEKLILILIISDTSVSGSIFRQAIRATWAKNLTEQNGWTIRIGFIIGNQTHGRQRTNISEEVHHYHDIIQASIGDGYDKLTEKTIMGFRWAQQYCSKALLIMRITHDVVVNVRGLIKEAELFHAQQTTRLYLGKTIRNATIMKRGKYKFRSPVRWPTNKYPAFQAEPGYVISMDLAIELNAMFCRTPIAFPDDTYVGALVDALGVNATTRKLFTFSHRYKENDLIMVTNNTIIVHFVRWTSKAVEKNPTFLYNDMKKVSDALLRNNAKAIKESYRVGRNKPILKPKLKYRNVLRNKNAKVPASKRRLISQKYRI